MGQTFDRVLLARHFALCAGAAAAYFLRSELHIGFTAIAIVGVSGALNFAAYFFRTRAGMARICFVASPIIGIGGWGCLIAVTGGILSPFIAGLWLEIILSAMAMEPAGIIAVTGGAVIALWLQQVWVGIPDSVTANALALQSGFIAGMGIATFLVTRRWLRAQDNMTERHAELSDRLGSLARELEDERVLGQMGEHVARLAHGLKNAVHSLRGFVSLIEPRLADDDDKMAIDGLRTAINDLEALARATLETTQDEASTNGESGSGALATVSRAVRDISISHPGIEWSVHTEGTEASLPLAPDAFHEVLLILLGNSAEAMKGHGKGLLETFVEPKRLRVLIHDEGVGFSPESIQKLFSRGFTTKPEGNGYGLFLARRVLEQHGGSLELKPRPGRGATVEVSIPLNPVGGVGRPIAAVR